MPSRFSRHSYTFTAAKFIMFPAMLSPKAADLIAYGCDNVEEQELFLKLTERNALNMLFTECKVLFPSKEELEHSIESEVSRWTNS